MTVVIRKIAGTDRDYVALRQKVRRRATYFVYFQDNLWGAIALHNFAEMLCLAGGNPPQLRLIEQELSLKHPEFLNCSLSHPALLQSITVTSGRPVPASLTRQTPYSATMRSRESLQSGNRAHSAGLSAHQSAPPRSRSMTASPALSLALPAPSPSPSYAHCAASATPPSTALGHAGTEPGTHPLLCQQRHRIACSRSNDADAESHYPSWGSKTSRRSASSSGSRDHLITPHGDRNTSSARAAHGDRRGPPRLITPHGDRKPRPACGGCCP